MRDQLIVKAAIERSENWLRRKTSWNQHKLFMSRDQESLIDIASAIRRALRYTDSISRSQLEANDENCLPFFSPTNWANQRRIGKSAEWSGQWDANISLFGRICCRSQDSFAVTSSATGTLVADLQRLSTK